MIDIPKFSLDMSAIYQSLHDPADLSVFSVCTALLALGFPVCQSFFKVKGHIPNDLMKLTSRSVSVFFNK